MSFWIRKYQIELEQLPFGLLVKSVLVVFLCIGILSSILLLLPIQDKIKGTVMIYTRGQPLSVIAPSSGFLHLQFSDNQIIKKGDLLASIDVDIDQISLNQLKTLVENDLLKLDFNNTSYLFEQISSISTKDFREINNELYALLDKLRQLEILNRAADPKKMISTLDRSIQLKSEQLLTFGTLHSSTQDVINLIQVQLDADSALVEAGGLSIREYNETRRRFINQKAELIENQLRKQNLAGDIIEDEKEKFLIEQQYNSRVEELRLSIFDDLSEIRKKFQEYTKKYLIVSPIDGQVSLNSETTNQEMIQEGATIMYLTQSAMGPSTRSEMYVGAQNAGKIKPGMSVRVGLSEFDQKEYGIYYTKVTEVSDVQLEGAYKISLECSLPLTTSYELHLPLRSTYNGKGEILLGKINLLTKISREIQFNKEKYASL